MGEIDNKIGATEISRNSAVTKHSGLCFWLPWIAITIVYILIRINLVDIPLDRDEGVFGYIGQVILDNGLPYRDAFDHKPPLVFYLNALALLIVPPTPKGIHLFLHAYNYLTLIALFYLARVYSQSLPTALWVTFIFAIFSSSPEIQGFTASTEMYLLLPTTLSLLFAVLTVRKGRWGFSLLSGVCAALAFWTKQSAAFMILFITLYLLLAQMQLPPRQGTALIKALKSFLPWTLGFVLISSIIAGYFYARGAFTEFFYWSFTHSYLYSKNITLSFSLPRVLEFSLKILKANVLPIGVGLFSSLILIFKKDSKGYFALFFFILSMLATVHGVIYPHYFAQIAPAVAIIGGFGFAFLIDTLRNRKLRVVAVFASALAILLIPISVNANYYIKDSPDEFARSFFGVNPFPESVDLAQYILERTTPDDSIFIIGSEPQVLLYAKRKSASSFVMFYPLMASYPRYKEFQQKVWEEINNIRPKYVITIRLQTSILWDRRADLWILNKSKEMVVGGYLLEAVMTIKNPKGELILRSEQVDFESMIREFKFPIFIYKLKPDN